MKFIDEFVVYIVNILLWGKWIVILRNFRNWVIIIEYKGYKGIMKIKLFICFKILGFLIKKLIKLLENVLVYGKIYCIVRIIKNEFFFE